MQTWRWCLLQAAVGSWTEDELGRDDDPADRASVEASAGIHCCRRYELIGLTAQPDSRQQSGDIAL